MPGSTINNGPTPTLWVLTEVYFPEDISTGYYLTEIAEALVSDFEVKVITGQPKHMSRGLRAPKRESRNGVEIFRVWGTTFDKNSLSLRLVNMLTIGMSTLFRSLKEFRKGDRVLVVTAPPSMPLIATIAALAKGATTTVLIQDSYPEILSAVGKIGVDSLTARMITFFNRWVFKYARKLIVIGRDMKTLLKKKTEGLGVPVAVIPNWAELDSVHPAPRQDNALLTELGLSENFVVLLAGNLGPAIDLSTIVDASELLLEDPEVHILVIGGGGKAKWLRSQIHERFLSNVTLLDYRPRNEQNVFLNACDVGLVSLIRGMKGTAMPSRTYNLMAAGKPIIALCEPHSELEMAVREDDIGIVVEPGDVTGLRGAILHLKTDARLLGRFGKKARQAAEAKYSHSQAMEAYRKALR